MLALEGEGERVCPESAGGDGDDGDGDAGGGPQPESGEVVLHGDGDGGNVDDGSEHAAIKMKIKGIK